MKLLALESIKYHFRFPRKFSKPISSLTSEKCSLHSARSSSVMTTEAKLETLFILVFIFFSFERSTPSP